MVGTLTRKLIRDLRKMVGQIASIAVVVACGVSGYVTLQSAWSSLELSKLTYYQQNRFADVFAQLKRAPESLVATLEKIPGVAVVETRVVENVRIALPDVQILPHGRIVSLPKNINAGLNQPYLKQGRYPVRGHAEIILLEAFAKAHELHLGDKLPAIVNGTLRDFRIVGLGGSPEYIFALSAGDMAPDDKKFAVMWAPRDVVESAFQMIGAFNDVSLKLEAFTSIRAVLEKIDQTLRPYGGIQSVARDKQQSNYFLSQELQQLEGMATFIPIIFLAIAAFLLNTVLSRLIQMERGQIAILKALGYNNRQIAIHYFEFVLVIVLVGTLAGIGLGAYFGYSMTELYADFFRFPILKYELEAQTIAISFMVSFIAAFLGVFMAIKQAITLPPAEAMRPPSPPQYKRSWVEKIGLQKIAGISWMMILREIIKRPWRMILSTLAIAMAIAIMVAGRFSFDAFDYLLGTYLPAAQREHVQVDFSHPVPSQYFRHIESLPGVMHAEPMRAVPVEIAFGHQKRSSVLMTLENPTKDNPHVLRRLINTEGEMTEIPDHGVVLTDYLAQLLHRKPGDSIRIKILEGSFPEYEVQISGTAKELFGMQGYMTSEALHRMLKESPRFSSVILTMDASKYEVLKKRLIDMPQVLSISKRDDMYQKFRDQSGQMVGIFTLILALFASTIVAGVVYNNARISLSVRSRDLASLRVLGFTKAEISAILLGELSMQIVFALVPGVLLGILMSQGIASGIDPENYRLPVMISEQTILFATGVTIISGTVSALLVRRKLDRLDLISVLKTRE